jgi:type VI secretion system secreted protein VgrG
MGSGYGETMPPPFAAGVDSGVNHPGTISGLHSQALDDADGSQWVHDDATGQLRLRIHNAQWGSELGLGHLIQQGLNSAQRGAWRGSGFEAITQGWAVARAAMGLLASTQARPGTYGSAQGSQMDAHEAVSLLNGGRDLGLRLSDAAGSLGAQGLTGHADDQAVPSLVKLIDLDQEGRHEGESLTVPDDERAGAGQPVPAFAEPLVVLDSASALLAASGASTQLYAGQSLSLTAQGDLQQTAAHTYAQVNGQGTSLYAHEGGITAHAASGPVSIRAHTDVFDVLVEQGVTVSSVNDEIRIFAKDKLTFGAADSGFELNGGDITFTTPGTYKEQGGTHAFLPGASAAAQLTALPGGVVGELPTRLELDYRYRDLTPVVGAPYIVRFNDGTVREGVLDDQGHAEIENPPDAGRVFFGYDSRDAQPKRERPANGSIGQVAQTPEEAQAILQQYLAAEDEYLADNYFEDEIAGLGDVEFDDLIDDYVYEEEDEHVEDEQSPGTHEEHVVEESQGEQA